MSTTINSPLHTILLSLEDKTRYSDAVLYIKIVCVALIAGMTIFFGLLPLIW
jgi:hypothetical protein